MKVDFTHDGKVASLAAGNYQDAAPNGKRKATAEWTFSGLPTAGDTITVNGVEFAFVAADPGDNEILIGGDAGDTIDNAVSVLNASEDEDVAVATYANVTDTKLRATVDEYGAEGSDYTAEEDASNVTVADFGGGSTADDLDLSAETIALVTPAAVNNSTIVEWDLPPGAEGQEVTLYLKTKGASANAKVNGTFTGGTALTLDTVGKFAKLKFLDGTWRVIANTGSIA